MTSHAALLREALARLSFLCDRSSEAFDLLADEFYVATRYMRPGKSEPMGMYVGEDHEKARRAAWDAWITKQWAEAEANAKEALAQPSTVSDEIQGIRFDLRALTQEPPQTITVWKDGTHKQWSVTDAHYARNEIDWLCEIALQALSLPSPSAWRPIEDAPHNINALVAYQNSLGKWRIVKACYYEAGTLPSNENDYDSEDEFAPEGWYEACETHDDIYQIDTPSHFQPLPTPPETPRDK